MKKYLATAPPKGGHASDAGAKSITFQAVDEDAARALCDLHGYRFDGPSVPKKERTWADGQTPNRHLSKKQIIALNVLAREAFDHLDKYDLIEEEAPSKSARFSLWRHNVQERVTGHTSLKQCRNKDFRPLKLEFLKLAGRPFDSPEAVSTGQQSAAPQDTAESRETWFRLIKDELENYRLNYAHKFGDLTPAYLLTIARAQNKYQTLPDF
ncbi:MAG: hypothetical protein ACQKBY_05085, partial [Verrucomicrobiales bacterium]